MRDIQSDSAIIGLWDPTLFDPPEFSTKPAFKSSLRTASTEGRLFFIDSEDPMGYRIKLLLDQDLESPLAEQFEPRAGGFRLSIPSGKLCLDAIPPENHPIPLEAPPGDYIVTPYAREFQPGVQESAVKKLVSERDWRIKKNLERLGLVGCFAFVLLIGLILLPPTRHLWWLWGTTLSVLLAALKLSELLPASRRVAAASKQYSSQFPDMVLSLKKTQGESDVSGGWWLPGF